MFSWYEITKTIQSSEYITSKNRWSCVAFFVIMFFWYKLAKAVEKLFEAPKISTKKFLAYDVISKTPRISQFRHTGLPSDRREAGLCDV